MKKDYALRRTILAAMNAIGIADARQIAAALGPGWLTPQKRASLRQMLRIMEKEHLVMWMPTGKYRALAGRASDGFGTPEEIVQCIAACLRETNNAMRLEDLLDYFVSERLWARDERDAQTSRIFKIIGEARRLGQVGDHIYLASEFPSGFVEPAVAYEETLPSEVPPIP